MNAKIKFLVFVSVLVALMATACSATKQDVIDAVNNGNAPLQTAVVDLKANSDAQGQKLDAQDKSISDLGGKVDAQGQKIDADNAAIAAQGQKIDAMPTAPAPVDPNEIAKAVVATMQPQIKALVPTAMVTPTAVPLILPDPNLLNTCLKTNAVSVGGLKCDDWRMPDQSMIDACVKNNLGYVEDQNGRDYICADMVVKQKILLVVYAELGISVTGPQQPTATATAPASSNPAVSATPQANGTTTVVTQGSNGSAIDSTTHGSWEVTFFNGVTDQMRKWFSLLRDPAPALWPVFPNQPNPKLSDADWRVVTGADGKKQTPDGLEYGLDESVFCQTNEPCHFPVQTRGYRYYSGDYDLAGIDSCNADTAKAGCMLVIFNVGEINADFVGTFRQGFSVAGRYWNGDVLNIGMWGITSAGSANMLNMTTNGAGTDTLNNPYRTNAGGNCSVPTACQKVRVTIVITSGNQMLVKATTTVVNPTSG